MQNFINYFVNANISKSFIVIITVCHNRFGLWRTQWAGLQLHPLPTNFFGQNSLD